MYNNNIYGNSPTYKQSKPSQRSISDPIEEYTSMLPLWRRARAILNGERQAKNYDEFIDTVNFSNLLIPFSPCMRPEQYRWYLSEAELPGLVNSYAKVLIGGLLRKKPILEIENDEIPEDAKNWILNSIGSDGKTLHALLDEALWEEVQTSRAWLLVDYPEVQNYDALTPEQIEELAPYVMVIKGENVINWRVSSTNISTKNVLSSILFRYYMPDYSKNPFHPDLIDTLTHYYLDDQGLLVVDTYRKSDTVEMLPVINGQVSEVFKADGNTAWNKVNTTQPLMNGERMSYIPCWPLNGSITPQEPMLMPLIDREISLYNKVSRRNHLLLGAATYTPVVMSDMSDEEFDDIVSTGLGSWIKVRQGDDIKALETPTAALKDMEIAIQNTIEDLAKMGIRMLSPDSNSGDSGVALEIRNSAQTSKISLMSTRVSETMRDVICCLLKWKYNVEVDQNEVKFLLSTDLNPAPAGEQWLRLVTEWYQSGIIPRSTFIEIAKHNDVLPADYDDEEGLAEIQSDPLVDTRPMRIDASLTEGATS